MTFTLLLLLIPPPRKLKDYHILNSIFNYIIELIIYVLIQQQHTKNDTVPISYCKGHRNRYNISLSEGFSSFCSRSGSKQINIKQDNKY